MNTSKLVLIRRLMLLLNISIIAVICYVYLIATEVIINSGASGDFLYRASFAPLPPPDKIWICTLLLLAMILNTMLRESLIALNKNPLIFLSFLLDIFFCVSIILATNVDYRGILLMAVSYILFQTENKKQKVILVCIFILFYIVCQYELATQYFKIIPLNTYIEYLDPSRRSFIYVLKNILYSCNDILFVIFMVYWIQLQMDETSSLNELYEQQYRTNEELKLANIQLEHYASQSEETVKMRERNRMARDIHDTIGHSLTAISAGLDACRELLLLDREQLGKQIEALSDISKDMLLQVRSSVKQLRVDTSGDMALEKGILKLADEISAVTHTQINYHCAGNGWISPAEGNVIYRTVQESITNSVRHGKATFVDILLEIKPEMLRLTIEDNGAGCSDLNPGTGLTCMRERAAELNGAITFTGDGHFKTQLTLPREEVSP